MFISMAYLILDHVRATVTLSRAGHDAPCSIAPRPRKLSPLKPPGMVLGIDSGSVFDRMTGDFAVPLERDDCLVLYTDGVTEALDSEGYEFGMDRMMQSVRASAARGAAGGHRPSCRRRESLRRREPQHDDITLIAIRKT